MKTESARASSLGGVDLSYVIEGMRLEEGTPHSWFAPGPWGHSSACAGALPSHCRLDRAGRSCLSPSPAIIRLFEPFPAPSI